MLRIWEFQNNRLRHSGDYVVAKNDENEATFKQHKKVNDTRILHPLNPKYPDIVLNKEIEYKIVGVVMEGEEEEI